LRFEVFHGICIRSPILLLFYFYKKKKIYGGEISHYGDPKKIKFVAIFYQGVFLEEKCAKSSHIFRQ
jgi:hypothetical protein